MQINLGNLKVNTVDRSFVNIGPSIKAGLRTNARMNQGHGEIVGDGNIQTSELNAVDDRDGMDNAIRNEVLPPAKRPR